MKLSNILLNLVAQGGILFSFLPLNAQDLTGNPIEIIEEESEGMISIEIPDNILTLILSNQNRKDLPALKPGMNKLAGYRIQVFSDGRNPHTLESRAKARGNAILSKFPKYKGQIYTYSSSPNWFTRVGNFRTTAEANAAMSELKKAFPNFASEMRVVKSQIVIVK